MELLKTVSVNVVGAIAVFTVVVAVTLGVIRVTGAWDALSIPGLYQAINEDASYERADKRGL